MTDAPKSGPDRASHELAEDVLGFGRRDIATAKDLLIRPATVLRAWMEQGPEGGGGYARPLRLYLALSAILMLLLFLSGGAGFMLEGMPASLLDPLLEQSGKSRDAFIGDADNWMTLVMVPLLSACYALATAPLLRWWDKEDLGWRRGFRASFAWLCAWTVPMLPLAWWTYGPPSPVTSTLSAIIMLLGVITFFRMGRGRWFSSGLGGVVKAVALMLAVQIGGIFGGVMVGAIGILGALASG
jgi:hypothetical protein